MTVLYAETKDWKNSQKIGRCCPSKRWVTLHNQLTTLHNYTIITVEL